MYVMSHLYRASLKCKAFLGHHYKVLRPVVKKVMGKKNAVSQLGWRANNALIYNHFTDKI